MMKRIVVAAVFAAGFGAPAWADCGGTITAGGTAQDALTADPSRKYAVIQNTSDSENLYVQVDGTATVADSGNLAKLLPEGSVYLSGSLAGARVSVIATTTSHPFNCTEWR